MSMQLAKLAGPVALLSLSLLVACGDNGEDARRRADDAAAGSALPAPESGDGSVTGMPDAPGPGEVPITGAPPQPEPEEFPGDAFGLPPLEDNPETGLLAVDEVPATAGEPVGTGPAGVIRDYYAAINAGDFGRAYALWSDGGRSSGQSPDQFANAFAETTGITAQIGELAPIAGGSGARLVQVPVSITSTLRDGSVRRYRGSYVLRRPATDGADDGQHAWRIASADLREVQP